MTAKGSGFFGELRRRGVLGALAAYGVAAAGALQLADVVVHNLGLPGWTLRALIWVAALGFAATAVVSWSYDLTRRGFVRTRVPEAVSPPLAAPRASLAAGPAAELEPGTLLGGRYRLERELGKGGMGRVFAARDERLGRRVAVKVVTAAHDPARVRRFEQEAKTAGSLEHPNVLAVYDLGEQDGVPFLVTELLAGHTLRTIIDGPRLPPAQVQGLLLQLARGLAAAHARGIVHRDLKPENLFLTDDGRLKILDFGLARLTFDGEVGAGLTASGAIFGSPGYLSPEQARGERVGPPSDVFSAGAVIYEMLSSRRAFPGGSLVEAGHAALTATPEPLPATVPPPLGALVMRCLEKDPQRRVRDGAALAAATERLAPAAPVTLPPQPRSWRRSTSVMLAIAMLAIGAALASGVRVLRSSRSRGERRERGLQRIPAIPIPPVPPQAGEHPPEGEGDQDELVRDLKRQLQTQIPRAGRLGLLAGARALERAGKAERAETLLRKARDPIAKLELYLLMRDQGRAADGQEELRAVSQKLPAESWPAPLFRAFLGKAKDAEAIAAAGDEEERCEARYYLGRLRLPEDAALARGELQKAAESSCDLADFAQQELDAIQSR